MDLTRCRWYYSEGDAFLDYNAGCIAWVRASGLVRVQAWGVMSQAQAASQAQGIRFVERWVAARRGFPGMGPRRVSAHRAALDPTRPPFARAGLGLRRGL